MKLFEIKNDVVTINIDTNFLKKYNRYLYEFRKIL